MNRKKDMIDIIQNLSGRFSPYEVFCDFVHCSAVATANSISLYHDKLWEKREAEYMDIRKKYSDEEFGQFPELMAMLVETLEDNMSDVLGEIYMDSGMGNKNTGQFFTPFHLSKLTASLILNQEKMNEILASELIYEPSCGGGGMIIALAAVLKERGIDYQRIRVIAQDLDWKSVYMCYLQLSLIGMKAVVVQGNTLKEPYLTPYTNERTFYTPAYLMFGGF